MRPSPEEMERRHAQYLVNMEQMISAHGHMVQGVFCTEEEPGPGWSYTIGLQQKGWAEVLMIGINYNSAGVILNDLVAACVKRERGPTAGDTFTELANLPLVLVEMDSAKASEYGAQAFARAARLNQPEPTYLQAVMPDKAARFPWDEGYDHEYMDPRQYCLAPGGVWKRPHSLLN